MFQTYQHQWLITALFTLPICAKVSVSCAYHSHLTWEAASDAVNPRLTRFLLKHEKSTSSIRDKPLPISLPTLCLSCLPTQATQRLQLPAPLIIIW